MFDKALEAGKLDETFPRKIFAGQQRPGSGRLSFSLRPSSTLSVLGRMARLPWMMAHRLPRHAQLQL